MQIKKKLPLMMIILVCIPLLILSLVIYLYSSNALIEKSKDSLEQLVVTEGHALESLITNKQYKARLLALDERVIALLKEENKDNKTYTKIEQLLEQVVNSETCTLSYIVNRKGEVVVSKGEDILLQSISKEELESIHKGKEVFENIFVNDEMGSRVKIIVPVKDKQNRVLGAVCKIILNDCFRKFIQEISIDKTQDVYILDRNGNVIVHLDKNKEGKPIGDEFIVNMISNSITLNPIKGVVMKTKKDNVMQYVVLYKIDDVDWTIGICHSEADVQRQAFIEFSIMISAVVILGTSVIFVTVIMSKRITDPIDSLIDVMREVSEGKLDRYCNYKGKDELGDLAKHYNNMIKSLWESRQERESMLKELRRTQGELKNNIEELIKNKEALIISEERYRRTLDDIEETIWEYDTETDEFLIVGKWKKYVKNEEQNQISSLINIRGIEALSKVIEPESIRCVKESLALCKAGKIDDFSIEMKLNSLAWGFCKGKAITNEVGQVVKIRGIVTDITSHKMNEEKVRKLAYFDVLTGCLNKQAFMMRFKQLIDNIEIGKKSVLFFVDLDNFKKVNDIMGHEIGDNLLNYVGNALKVIFPVDVLISRFGGDEFAIYKNNVSDIEEIKSMAEDILNIFKDKIMIDEQSIHITCSIGIALYPLDGTTCKTLLKNADTAMYKAKEQGKNKYNFYAEDMSKVLKRKLYVESALRDAISGGEGLYLEYQPIVEAATGKTVAAEALIRLKTEQLGYVSPVEFIPIAEETGLILEVGNWVIENAINNLKYYRQQGYEKFSISINISAVQIENKQFIETLKHYVEIYKVPPECIKLEVTETVLMENIQNSKIIFDQIRAMGIKIALDDFGTGYSSLNYLRNIPLDVLKIDKSFIDEIETSVELSEIVSSIIDMAHILDLSVVAEGVETEKQLEILKQKGCDLIQGYVFSRPLMKQALAIHLKQENIR